MTDRTDKPLFTPGPLTTSGTVKGAMMRDPGSRDSAFVATVGRGEPRSLEQWRGCEKNGQFRFTPPTHVMLAFDRALAELKAQGGVEARGARYARWQRRIVEGMRGLGFEPYLDESLMRPDHHGVPVPGGAGVRFRDLL